jgi:hypothetical protein
LAIGQKPGLGASPLCTRRRKNDSSINPAVFHNADQRRGGCLFRGPVTACTSSSGQREYERESDDQTFVDAPPASRWKGTRPAVRQLQSAGGRSGKDIPASARSIASR